MNPQVWVKDILSIYNLQSNLYMIQKSAFYNLIGKYFLPNSHAIAQIE